MGRVAWVPTSGHRLKSVPRCMADLGRGTYGFLHRVGGCSGGEKVFWWRNGSSSNGEDVLVEEMVF